MTPMMTQYFGIKKQYEHCLVLYRLGDFYELFFEDAITASKELGLTLTGRDCGEEERAPMCGVPFHAVDGYIAKLVEKGYKVAICEQVEDAKDVVKGIVKRDVVRVITAGTVTDYNSIDQTKNNYIMAIFQNMLGFGISICDVTTGDFITTSVEKVDFKKLCDEIARFEPVEIIVNDHFLYKDQITKIFDVKPYFFSNWSFEFNMAKTRMCKHFNVATLQGLGFNENVLEVCACGAMLSYLLETQKNSLKHISKVKRISEKKFMLLDMSSRRNLELTQTIREGKKKGSLMWVINQTITASGGRMLRHYIEQPLINKEMIVSRLDAVEEFKNNFIACENVREKLSEILDVERILGKIIYGNANARDLLALKKSIKNFPEIKTILENCECELIKELNINLGLHEDVFNLIDGAISEEAPVTIKDGEIIKDGFSNELDLYRVAKNEGTNWLLQMESEEREKTGIKSLKIKFNKIFGYFIEVTNSYLKLVPERYTRRQTMANGERYITQELKEIEEKILGAESKIGELEYSIFKNIVDEVAHHVNEIKNSVEQISVIDVISSLAIVAEKNKYCKPKINQNGVIDIKEGRHPVVEKISDEAFIPNDTYLDLENERLAVITGPNMAGKSTYMRQVALISVLAQMGSFVPASFADIAIVDQIFTRVGASDDLATGQSTFMVEMSEVANILNNATKNSLLILDEIGRGTSTFDGLSLAWSILEYIADKKFLGAKTLFATHYHELTELEGNVDGVNNFCVTVSKDGENIVFLRKIEKGCIDHSYGIQVARLAGIPNDLIARSKQILEVLEKTNINQKSVKNLDDIPYESNKYNKNKDDYKIIVRELQKIDIDALTPRDALKMLYNLKDMAKD